MHSVLGLSAGYFQLLVILREQITQAILSELCLINVASEKKDATKKGLE